MTAIVTIVWADGVETRREALSLTDAERIAAQITRTYGADEPDSPIDEIRIDTRTPTW